MGSRRVRVLAWLAVLVMTAAGLAGPGAAGAARATAARPSGLYQGTPHRFPARGVSGVSQLCGPAADYSCDTGGYAGQSTGWWGKYYGAGWASSNSYGYHNCTLYAAYRIARNGVGDPGKTLGNAYQWAATAQGLGIGVDQTPVAGAVAQWTNHAGGNVGHVAYVEVVTNSYIVISDDNYGLNTTDRFQIAVGSPAWPDNFIHFRDTYTGEIVHWNADPSSPKAAWRVGSDQRRHWIASAGGGPQPGRHGQPPGPGRPGGAVGEAAVAGSHPLPGRDHRPVQRRRRDEGRRDAVGGARAARGADCGGTASSVRRDRRRGRQRQQHHPVGEREREPGGVQLVRHEPGASR